MAEHRRTGKERGVRLNYAMVLVVATAAGLALERVSEHLHRDAFQDIAKYPRWVRNGIYLTESGDPFFAGLILVGGVDLWVETGRRREARVWGLGRLTWSVSFCVAILISLKEFVWVAGREIENVPPALGPVLGTWWGWFTSSLGTDLARAGLAPCLIGLLITSLAARWPRDPSPDAREWAGRLVFGALILLYLTHESLSWYWE